MVTIKDVAREARVSVATVSRALNGSTSVTARTRAHVQRVAERLHYVPMGAARSLVTGRTQTIGALLPDLYGEFFSELIRGIDLAARAHGLHLLVSSSHGDADESASALNAMQGRVDGVLVMSPHVDDAFLERHLAIDTPAVLLNGPSGSDGYVRVNVDNRGGAHAMARHLLACGHRRFAFVAGPPENHDAGERQRGFEAALRESDADVEWQCLPGDFGQAAGYLAGRKLVEARWRPDAVFAANDMMAIGCLRALTEAGLRVPADIALAGFDDIPTARFVHPPLTTVRVRVTELGQMALDRLVARIRTPDAPVAPDATLACEVVVRASSGAPADAPDPESG